MSGGSGGGSGKGKKIWIGLGVGCLAILLVIGIAFALGAFKAVSCCQDFQGAMVKTQGAQQFGVEFAGMLEQGQLEQAYAATTESFQSQMSYEQFQKAVEAHREGLNAGPPVTTNFMARNKPNEELAKINEWRMSVQFVGGGDRVLALDMTVTVEGEGEAAEFKIEDMKFENEMRNLAAEAPAQEVLGVHDFIRNGNYDMAYSRMGQPFTQQTNRDAFREFLEDAGDVLTDSQLSIRDVQYGPQGRTATVMAQATTPSGQNAIVQYELAQEEAMGFQAWRIVAIAPVIAQEKPADVEGRDAGQAPDATPVKTPDASP